jgi:predicted phosphate transport protein (TIGR00153 family)
MRLIPRDEKFFQLFLKQVRLISQASDVLLTGVKTGNAKMAAACETIQRLEHDGDDVIHDILTRLNQTFITPLDPEDIHSLSSSLDDVLDGIEDAAYQLTAHNVEPIPPAVVELCEIVNYCSHSIALAFQALHDGKALLEHCVEINRLEGVADLLVRRVLAELYRSDIHPMAFIKLKEVYEVLEATTDRCEDVADALQGVVVKNS